MTASATSVHCYQGHQCSCCYHGYISYHGYVAYLSYQFLPSTYDIESYYKFSPLFNNIKIEHGRL
jgi:hypothetical protein